MQAWWGRGKEAVPIAQMTGNESPVKGTAQRGQEWAGLYSYWQGLWPWHPTVGMDEGQA